MASLSNLYQEDKLVEDASAFIMGVIETRFDPDMPPEWKEALAEYGLDMFEAGAAFAENSSRKNQKEIITTH
jgi:hypothetical protein